MRSGRIRTISGSRGPLSSGPGFALKVAVIYLLFSVLWILGTDSLLELLAASDMQWLASMQTIKGLLFVGLSALLIFFLVQRYSRSIRETEVHLRTLVDTLPDLVWLKNADGIFLACNAKFERLYGARVQDILGKTDYDFVDTELADFFRKHDLKAMHADGPSINEEQVTYADDGHIEMLETIKTPMKDDNGKLIGILGVGRDITERKQRESENRILNQAVEQSPVSVVLTDTEGRIEFVNGAFEEISGYQADEVLGRVLDFLCFEDDSDALFNDIWRKLGAGEHWRGELRNQKKNGEQFWEQVSISPVMDESGRIGHYLAVKEDVSLRKRQDEELRFQAHYDLVTGLPNRALVLDRLQQQIKEAERNRTQVAVMFLDLDDFKKINDCMGHDMGDLALQEAARRLRDGVRQEDTVARLGGDEFLIVSGGIKDDSGVSVIAEHVLLKFRQPFQIEGRQISLTASLGVALYPDDGRSTTELLKNADSAMYSSKSRERNSYSFFDRAMDQKLSRRLQIEEHLAGAIARGELSLCYQPQIDVASRQMIGVEALLRWNCPALGPVAPDEFIPVAEQTGLILPIGRFVLQEATTAAAGWAQALPTGFKLAVNFSPNQFRDRELLAFVQELLGQDGVERIQLVLEITEGVLMSGDAAVESALHELSELGIHLAMDDFGTGYSSLSYLREYPFDLLKIDRSFIQDMTEDRSDLELVNAAVSLGHGLGIMVVAEGVETQAQLNKLEQMGCDYLQGYLFSKPLPASGIDALIKEPERLACQASSSI